MDIGVIQVTDKWNPSKVMEYKKSKCRHFYMRQLIEDNPLHPWQRVSFIRLQETQKRYSGT